jgi:hypothetical protein
MLDRKLSLRACAAALAVAAGVQLAYAGCGFMVSVPQSRNDTAFSLGIQYDFGDMQAELVGSVRRTHTNTGNDVTGGKLDVAIPLFAQSYFPTFRAMGLAGSTKVQGEAGVGYDFAKQLPLLGAGVQGPYSNAGANFDMNGVTPYAGANTLKDAPARTTVEIMIVC